MGWKIVPSGAVGMGHAALAFERGLPLSAFKGQLRRWLLARLAADREDNTGDIALRVYGTFVYIYAEAMSKTQTAQRQSEEAKRPRSQPERK